MVPLCQGNGNGLFVVYTVWMCVGDRVVIALLGGE